MAFWNTSKKHSEYDEYDNDGYYEPAQNNAPVEEEDEGGLGLSGNNIELKVVRPESFAEVSTIADYLLSGCTVFLNLEATDKDICRRILDFLSGVAYAKQGQMKKVAASTFIISPKNVDVSEDAQSN